MKLASRLNEFESYLGTAMNLILTRMKKEGKDVINLGLGDPDVVPTEEMRRCLADACLDVINHHYASFYDPMPLKEAMAAWYQKRFGVGCDPDKEVLPLLGAADGLFHIHTCLLNAGDTALIPDPCYPAYIASAKIAGGVVVPVPLLKQNGFLPDLDSIDPETARRARMIWINYPNNPTAAHAPDEFYRKLIKWAQRYDVAVISDNPYSELCFDGYSAPSFLKFDGAKEVGVELNSLSKAYNSCGWRVGMMLGNPDIIAGMTKIKSHSDRGLFYPLQKAATEALNGSDAFMTQRNQMFRERRDVVVDALKRMGIAVDKPKATFYVWAAVPDKNVSSKDWCLRVLDKIAVWMIPGSMYGAHGEGFFRIALTNSAERLRQAMERLGNYLQTSESKG